MWVGLTLIFDIPPYCTLANPFFANFISAKQDPEEGGTAKIKVNQTQLVRTDGPPCKYRTPL